ncbi:scavenger receptor cysteine-rich type 1 protein M160-like, partial [Triplophysa rosa]|uniref:scavenger receptor cysteine-rich type 1 protein M160-like n=1 Tax=Triplophysa rosa TaxID=992332 RepID=UPI002546237A
MEGCLTIILLSSIVRFTTAGRFRLVGGSNSCAGRVEIYYNGEWGTVCADYWDLRGASVLCRDLGCDGNLGTMHLARFGPGSGKIWTYNVQCSGSESTPMECRGMLMEAKNCNHNEDPGIICSGVRLVGGSRCSGRVEVPHGNTWKSVCDAAFDDQDAEVVCREMGCGPPVQLLGADAFGEGEGPVWTQDIQCRGNEYQFDLCPTSPSNINCSHENDVGIVCAETVRLVDGGSRCAGRVEVLHDGQWGTVSHDGWDLTDAAVVCRELGCGEAVEAPTHAYFGEGKGPVWSNNVRCTGQEPALIHCETNRWRIQSGNHANDVGIICSAIRLVGSSHCSGRVEMHRGDIWMSVCDAAFDDQDAEVVCRELNCGVPVQRLGADAFGEGEGPVWTQDIQCRGNESQLLFCPQHFTKSSKVFNCSHDNDVGLICSGYTALRLVNGPDFCSGRVERQYFTEWGTVCDGCMNMRAASVVCRQMNCGIAVSVVGVDWFGEGSGEIWADVFDCQGNETQLSQCSISSWSRAEYSHEQDVGVICSNSSLALHDGGVRLSGERDCEGELEVYIDQVWRRVLLDSWSVTESSVVCRQLGCGSVLNFSGSSSSSAEHSHECVMGFKCSGTEHHLRNCSSSPQTLNCSSTQHLSITCLGQNDRSIRLVGSGGDCAGRLEVFHKGSWGTVCDDSWDIKDAHVVCRQLQCGVALSDQPVPAWFGPGSGLIWLDDVNCEGNETSLWNCSSRVWGDHDCKHKEDVGVVCSEFKELRLSEGCEGNVEVFYNGSWGNVCYNQMNRNTASLICQELNCGRSVGEPSYSDGLRSQNWLNELKCRSHDSTLWQCPSSPWAPNDCNEDEVAKITCSEKEIHEVPRSRLKCSTSPSPHQRQCSSHVPLRLSGGKGRCSGRLEVYHNSEWGSVCDDLWDIRDAQVVCRQLGCGAALSADGNEAFGAGEGVVWLNRVECRGTEIHLWDCPHVLNNHTDCSRKERVRLICADLSVSTTTTASPSVSQTSRRAVPSTTVTPPQTPPAASLFIPPVVVIVLGVLLLLLLVPLLILIQHNRVMRRALSKRRHVAKTEAVYEEIDHRHTNRHKHFTQRGSLISEKQHSEDADESFSECDNEVTNSSGIKGEQTGNSGYYNDVNTDGLTVDHETADASEHYDDVVIIRQNVQGINEEDQEYDDVKNISASRLCEELKKMKICLTLILLSSIARLSTAGRVKLVGGSNSCAGRVEVYYKGEWGTVCDDYWDLTAASVLCRELGCDSNLDTVHLAYFGPGSGKIWKDNVECSGSETTILSCSSKKLGDHNCKHNEDAGVICSGVRLVGGSRCSGRVEMPHGNTWMSVCDAAFDDQDAEVVCREMGCGPPVQRLGADAFGKGEGPVWTQKISCKGNEYQFALCPASPSRINCSHENDVGIVCAETLRLGGTSRCAGRVEVLHDGQWGTVSHDGWDLEDAAVVCRELNCGDALEAPTHARFGQGKGPIWINNVLCSGSESALTNCQSNKWLKNGRKHANDAGVICSAVKLVGGSRCTGRVEMPHGDTWMSVCDAAFDDQDAEVVCRELNCGVPVQRLRADAFGEGEGPVWTQDIQCTHEESYISLCPLSPSPKDNCTHENDVGLKCSGYTDLRLVNGSDICSGRVERQYFTEWGTVCDGCMNMRAASVVCRQMNCGIAVSVVGVDWFGEGSGEIWADVFDCQGNETQLSQCSISSWSRAEYSHEQDVGVICSNSSLALHDGGVRLSGERDCEGELEVYIDQVWRRVLLDSWSVTESSVVCRQLGCGSVLNFSGSSSSSAEHSHECVMGFKCSGTEHHLRNCSSSPQTLNCSSTQHLSITCLGERWIRLVGSGGDCVGRLEVFHKGSWGTVCDDSWDIKDAHVVCRQLQCGVALSDQPVPAWFGPGSGLIWLDDVNCEGNETSLWNCSSRVWGDHDCNHKEDVGVVCSEFKEIRLSEGCEGNVEVFYNGSWGNVCWNQMNRDTASLICQELNCGRSGVLSASTSRVSSAHNWLDNVECRPHDSNIWQCISSPWGENDCSQNEVAHITCSEKVVRELPRSRLTCSTSPSPHQIQCSSHVPLRLSGGKGRCSGRLEVYHNSEWGSVCDDLWDIRDAQVVCRQLGCGAALSADGNEAFGAGEGVVWLNRVECRGTEIHLWDCPHVLNKHTDCSHKERVELICAGEMLLVKE